LGSIFEAYLLRGSGWAVELGRGDRVPGHPSYQSRAHSQSRD